MAATKCPLLRFGMIADVQYADNEDRPAWYNPAKTRFYRNSLKQVEKAFMHWEKFERETNCKVSFILQLGDIIDALNTSTCSQSAIHRTLSCFLNNPHMPTFHTVGNHELYNFTRTEISHLFDKFLFNQKEFHQQVGLERSIPSVDDNNQTPLYYKFNPAKGIKFISLDTYDVSVLGYDPSHPKYKMASDILEKHHGCIDEETWDSDKNLTGPNRRFQSSNGALSEEQLSWLDNELEISDRKNELVIVFGHVGLHPKSCGWESILWNYDQVIDCFKRHSSVVAYFNGHAHNSGFVFEDEILYVVLHGVIETMPESDAFSTVTIYEDYIDIDGAGVENKMIIPLRKHYSFDESVEQQQQQAVCDEEVHVVQIKIEV